MHGHALPEQFGLRLLRVFGSLSLGSTGPETGVDVLGRSLDLVAKKELREEFRPIVEADAISI